MHAACESKSTDCVKFLIDEIMDARVALIHDDDDNDEENDNDDNEMDELNARSLQLLNLRPFPHMITATL